MSRIRKIIVLAVLFTLTNACALIPVKPVNQRRGTQAAYCKQAKEQGWNSPTLCKPTTEVRVAEIKPFLGGICGSYMATKESRPVFNILNPKTWNRQWRLSSLEFGASPQCIENGGFVAEASALQPAPAVAPANSKQQ